jgi:choline/glycine/proline betaine transport protein
MSRRHDDDRGGWLDVHPVVFWTSAAIIVGLSALAVIATETVGGFFEQIQTAIVEDFAWVYLLSTTGFLGFVAWLMFSRHGSIRLGPDDARPAYSRPTWFAMLFSAGMGIGLLFFSVAEPISHFRAPPVGPGGTLPAARDAMALTFFHWGLHAWAIYAVVGLSLAYFGFRRGLPLSIRSAFYPLLGERIHGRIGDAIDILAIVSTLFGVATSLGLGAMQVNAGLHHVGGLVESTTVQVVIIAVITAMATGSVVSGLDVGIRRLSEINMGLAGLLLLFVFVVGPTAFLLNAFADNLGAYLQMLPERSLWAASFASPPRQQWLANWTIFYWAWWIAWAPFVGMFIARISRGRTVREFLVAVLLGPTTAGFVWLTVFGDTALHQEVYGAGGIADAVADDLPTAVFVLLERFPLASVTSVVCTVCVILFFVTSSDSASLVVDTIASGGKQDPPVAQRVFWALLEGVVAAALLLAGGLAALQTAALTTALPFCLVIVVMCFALARGLRHDAIAHAGRVSRARPDTP